MTQASTQSAGDVPSWWNPVITLSAGETYEPQSDGEQHAGDHHHRDNRQQRQANDV